MTSSDKPDWLLFLDRITADGTAERLKTAADRRQCVWVRRTSGTMQEVTLTSFAGGGGLVCNVEWVEPDGSKRYKYVDTRDVLTWNPSLDASKDGARDR